jgi:hypothetical protein
MKERPCATYERMIIVEKKRVIISTYLKRNLHGNLKPPFSEKTPSPSDF